MGGRVGGRARLILLIILTGHGARGGRWTGGRARWAIEHLVFQNPYGALFALALGREIS